jgi:serine O-acetyltransferase
MLKLIKEDMHNIFYKDPAARLWVEVLFCYPGLHAIVFHRLAHKLWKQKFYFTARFISHISRFLTGIEIHPGAVIGRRVFIDHGMGVVIGETAEVGNDVLIYKGVLLGSTTLAKKKRHPTIGNNVVLGSNAIVLGAIAIGNNAVVGAASVVTHDVPANATAVGVPARMSFEDGRDTVKKLEHSKLPDPIANAIKFVLEEQKKFEQTILEKYKQIEKKLNSATKNFEQK